MDNSQIYSPKWLISLIMAFPYTPVMQQLRANHNGLWLGSWITWWSIHCRQPMRLATGRSNCSNFIRMKGESLQFKSCSRFSPHRVRCRSLVYGEFSLLYAWCILGVPGRILLQLKKVTPKFATNTHPMAWQKPETELSPDSPPFFSRPRIGT